MSGEGRAGEQHGEEQQAAAEEDRREQPVLDVAQLVTHHPDEPQEGDAGERDQLQGPPDQPAAGLVGLQGLQRVVGQGEPHHHHRGDEQHGEQDAGDRRRTAGAPVAGGESGRGRAGRHRSSIVPAAAGVDAHRG
jgi:hypothetical protein